MEADLLDNVVIDEELGKFVCGFVERLPTTDTGKPFVLHPWQRDAIMEFYSTLEPFDEAGYDTEALVRKYQYLYLEIPKKNGKSELAAALGLYHLFADGEMSAEVYVCAADKENAGIVFQAAVFMLETAAWTAKMVVSGELKIIRSRRRIEFYQYRRAENGRIDRVMVGQLQVLSAEAYSKHGYKPSCPVRNYSGIKRLILRCYMPRTEQTAGTITAIEAGILRECSVGCAVRRAVCSVCGADQTKTCCPHIPGREYDGQLCVMALDGAKDAYEVSLVAVPAQPGAGVVKSKRYGGAETPGKNGSQGAEPPDSSFLLAMAAQELEEKRYGGIFV